jgi:hypothetical protein
MFIVEPIAQDPWKHAACEDSGKEEKVVGD